QLDLPSFPTRRSSDLITLMSGYWIFNSRHTSTPLDLPSSISSNIASGKPSLKTFRNVCSSVALAVLVTNLNVDKSSSNPSKTTRSEEHTSELQSRENL